MGEAGESGRKNSGDREASSHRRGVEMKVYNTLSAQKEEFSPQSDEVKMYVCGVTPYDNAHIGHAMSYIVFDVIRRYLQFRGYKVKYVQNITDIDDKIIDRANQLGISTHELAEKYTSSYFADMDALNIGRADIYPKATEEIPKIIEVIQGLIDKGYAYPAGGSVYFRVRNDPDYGKLAHRSLDSMMAGECAVGGEEKEDPMDFALWKASKPGEPSWPSPWGQGRPGWHIECSAMSLKYLGDTLDIHGGGQDLIFPHHENEIAQSESFTGVKPFVKYWLHNGLVQLGEDKMSKSIGNLITIKEALGKYSPDAIRIFILSSHYRSPLTYSEEGLEAAWRGAERLQQAARGEGRKGKADERIDVEPYRNRFVEAMDDDFNTAQAVATLFDLARDINRLSEKGYAVIYGQQELIELAGVLGLTLKPPERPPLDAKPLHDLITSINKQYQEAGLPLTIGGDEALPTDAEGLLERLISTRDQLRQAKQWHLADRIRAGAAELGIILEDTPNGTVWKYKR
jgi:cysteinyl-tRNA synthetase